MSLNFNRVLWLMLNYFMIMVEPREGRLLRRRASRPGTKTNPSLLSVIVHRSAQCLESRYVPPPIMEPVHPVS